MTLPGIHISRLSFYNDDGHATVHGVGYNGEIETWPTLTRHKARRMAFASPFFFSARLSRETSEIKKFQRWKKPKCVVRLNDREGYSIDLYFKRILDDEKKK